MSNDLISRKSVLDYIEKEIAKCESTETLCYLRALSVHINEFEPTAYDIDKVVEQLEEKSSTFEAWFTVREHKWNLTKEAIEIVKAGGIDE